jgi:hypothetical protein
MRVAEDERNGEKLDRPMSGIGCLEVDCSSLMMMMMKYTTENIIILASNTKLVSCGVRDRIKE